MCSCTRLARVIERLAGNLIMQDLVISAWAWVFAMVGARGFINTAGRLQRQASELRAGVGGRVSRRQFQHAGARQHSVGICAGKVVGYAAFHGVGEGGRLARRWFQHAGARQHSVGICAVKAVGYAAVRGVGDGGGAARMRS